MCYVICHTNMVYVLLVFVIVSSTQKVLHIYIFMVGFSYG